MKRINFLMVTLLLMGGMAMAQGSRRGGGDKQMDPKARAERMTERMVKEYSLNEDQKKQLLDANLAMLEQMKRPEGATSEMKRDKKADADETKAPKMTKEDREKMFQEKKASREAYDAQVKKILTPEQYDAYAKQQAERQKKMKEGRRDRR